MRMMFSTELMNSSSPTTEKKLFLSMLVRSFGMIKNGVPLLHLKTKEAVKGGS